MSFAEKAAHLRTLRENVERWAERVESNPENRHNRRQWKKASALYTDAVRGSSEGSNGWIHYHY